MVSSKYIYGVFGGLIALVVLFEALAVLIPDVQSAGNTVNATGAPLAALFASDGVVILLIMGAIVLAIMGAFWAKRRK